MKFKLRNKSAFIIALIFFGVLNFCDAMSQFGRQAVDLPPFRFFLFSCWVAIRNAIGYTFLACSLVFFGGRHSRWIIVPIYVMCVIIESAVLFTSLTFNANLAEIWLELLENTSKSEVMGFVHMITNWYLILFMLAICIIITVFTWLMFSARYPCFSKRSMGTGILCCLPFVLLNCLLMNWHFGLAQTRYTDFAIGTILQYKRMAGIRNAWQNKGIPKDLPTANNDAPDVIIVLGESATSKNWHLYGYSRTTTPCMDKLQAAGRIVVFRDVIGTQPATVSALGLLLTDVSFDHLSIGNWTLAGVYQKVGYRCIIISQQYQISDTTSTLFKIFNGCEKRISVSNEFGNNHVFDEKTIPLLERELALSDGRPNLIFIHLAGMHYPVQNVNPPECNYFSDLIEPEVLKGRNEKMRDRINRYDNAIRYEDKVLGGIIDVLSKCKRAVAFFFISDHGESPRANEWRDFQDEDVYCVPAIFWFSDEYRKRFPETVKAFKAVSNRPIQSDEMTYGLLNLGCIQSEFSRDPKLNFLCENFKGRKPRLINKGKMVVKGDLRQNDDAR